MIDAHALTAMTVQTRDLREGFAATAPRAWDPATAAAEFAVQAGHLALCLAQRRDVDVLGLQDADRPIHDVGDELADVVLAALGITVLSGAEPHLEPAPARAADPAEGLLVLLAAAGQLAEAAMVGSGYRHSPTRRLPGLAGACGRTVAAADQLAALLDVDLPGSFAAMHTDAFRFLASWQEGVG